jgi:hypothetical protein
MRDPARIEEILKLLYEVWRFEPDLRLGQLVFNAARINKPELQDIYSIEDAALRDGLTGYLELLASKRKLRLYKAIVWTDASTPGVRVTIEATSIDEAKEKLEAEHGKGKVHDLHNEEEANRVR